MAQPAKIDVYLDCNSFYSRFALLFLTKNREALKQHDVEVDFHPIFLGGVNAGSGNKPPWYLPAKATYGKYDGARAQRYFGAPKMVAPPFFPQLSILPLRSMLYIKDNFSRDRYEAQFGELWAATFEQHLDISKVENMAKCLGVHFNESEVKDILKGASSPEYKQKLTDETKALVEKGAFGAPWFIVRNKDGAVEPFFGSDRFHYMFSFLGVPYTDIAVLPPASSRL